MADAWRAVDWKALEQRAFKRIMQDGWSPRRAIATRLEMVGEDISERARKGQHRRLGHRRYRPGHCTPGFGGPPSRQTRALAYIANQMWSFRMATHNVVLTEPQTKLIDDLVASGRYQNASETLQGRSAFA